MLFHCCFNVFPCFFNEFNYFSFFLHWFFNAFSLFLHSFSTFFSLIFRRFFLNFSMLFNLGDMAPGAMSPAPEHVTAWHAQFHWVSIAFPCVRSRASMWRRHMLNFIEFSSIFFSFPYGNLNHLNENRRFFICWDARPSKYGTFFFPGPIPYIYKIRTLSSLSFFLAFSSPSPPRAGEAAPHPSLTILFDLQEGEADPIHPREQHPSQS